MPRGRCLCVTSVARRPPPDRTTAARNAAFCSPRAETAFSDHGFLMSGPVTSPGSPRPRSVQGHFHNPRAGFSLQRPKLAPSADHSRKHQSDSLPPRDHFRSIKAASCGDDAQTWLITSGAGQARDPGQRSWLTGEHHMATASDRTRSAPNSRQPMPFREDQQGCPGPDQQGCPGPDQQGWPGGGPERLAGTVQKGFWPGPQKRRCHSLARPDANSRCAPLEDERQLK